MNVVMCGSLSAVRAAVGGRGTSGGYPHQAGVQRCLRHALDECRDRVAGTDQPHGICGADDLVALPVDQGAQGLRRALHGAALSVRSSRRQQATRCL
jgi:hypothetical protein